MPPDQTSAFEKTFPDLGASNNPSFEELHRERIAYLSQFTRLDEKVLLSIQI